MITALLLTTLAVTIVASLFWQQQVQVRSMENQRLHLQTKWILRGALDWARLVLRQDALRQPRYTTLNAVWNTPLAETRLDQYIERERVEGEVFDATLSGRVIDATSRYNLRNLADGPTVEREPGRRSTRSLLRNLQLDPALAKRTADAVAAAPSRRRRCRPAGRRPPPPAKVPMQLLSRWTTCWSIPGYTPEIVAKLREFVIVLPGEPKPTAECEHGAGRSAGGGGPGLFAVRGAGAGGAAQAGVFPGHERFHRPVAGGSCRSIEDTLDVKSEFFLVQSRIRLDRANLDAEALVERKPGDGFTTTVVSVRQN